MGIERSKTYVYSVRFLLYQLKTGSGKALGSLQQHAYVGALVPNACRILTLIDIEDCMTAFAREEISLSCMPADSWIATVNCAGR